MFIECVAPGGGIPGPPDFSRVNRGDIAVGSGAPRGFPSGTSPRRSGVGWDSVYAAVMRGRVNLRAPRA